MNAYETSRQNNKPLALTLCDLPKPSKLDLEDAELIRGTFNHIKMLSTQRLGDLKTPEDLEFLMVEAIEEFYRGICMNRQICR